MQDTKTNSKTYKFISNITSFTSEKGITIISLVITVILMLILLGVTVKVSLDGSLFEVTDEAVKQTQIEADKKELLTSVVLAIGIDGKVNFDKLDSSLPRGFTGSEGRYTSEEGNEFIVEEDGDIKLPY